MSKKLNIELAERISAKAEKRLVEVYQAALDDVRAEIAKIYAKYSTNGILKWSDMIKTDGELLSRYEAMYASIMESLRKRYQPVYNEIIKTTKNTYKEGAYKKSYDIQSALGKEIGFAVINERAINQAIMNPISGLTLKELAKKDRAHVLEAVNSGITRGLVRGASINEMDKIVKQALGEATNNSQRIVRTEALRAFSQGQLQSENEAKDLGIKFKKTWSSAMDGRTRESHQAMNGEEADKDGNFTLITGPNVGAQAQEPRMFGIASEDIQCFLPDTKVRSLVMADKLYRRRHTKEVAIFSMETGESFGCTFNHPILRSDGLMVPAKLLNIGDYIGNISNEEIFIGEKNIYNGISTFKQCFDFLSRTFPLKGVSGKVENFHGDGIINEQVDIIMLESPLRNHMTNRQKSRLKLIFSEADAKLSFLPINSEFFQIFVGLGFAPDCLVSLLSKLYNFISGHFTETDDICLRTISEINAVFNKTFLNNISGNIINFRKFQNTFPVSVLFDKNFFRQVYEIMRSIMTDNPKAKSLYSNSQLTSANPEHTGNITKTIPRPHKFVKITNISIGKFETHVYNLQNSLGWYIISDSGFIVKNCRCTSIVDVIGFENKEDMADLKDFVYTSYDEYKSSRQ